MSEIRILTSLLALALAAAGCSGSDEAEPTDPPTTATTTTTAAPTTTTTTSTTTTPPTTSPTTTTSTTTTTTMDPRAGWPNRLLFGFQPRRGIAESREFAQAFVDKVAADLDVTFSVYPSADAFTIAGAMEMGGMDVGVLDARDYVLLSERFTRLDLLAQEMRFGDSSDHGHWLTNDPSICGADPVVGAFYYDSDGNVEPRGPTDTPALQVGWDSDGTRVEGIDAGLACPEPVALDVVTGRTIAFVIEESTTGLLVPALELLDLGITTDQYDSIFTGSHDAVVNALYDGTVDIGVTFDDARSFAVDVHPDVGSKVIAFNITPRIANPVIVVRADFPDTFKEALINAMVKAAGTLPGQTSLAEAIGWTALVRADDATLQSLETIARLELALGGDG